VLCVDVASDLLRELLPHPRRRPATPDLPCGLHGHTHDAPPVDADGSPLDGVPEAVGVIDERGERERPVGRSVAS